MKRFKLNKENRAYRIIGWYIVGIFFAIVVPIGINLAYNIPAPHPLLEMSWEAKDALQFYGSMLGAVATIFALVTTIKFTVSSQREERKLSVKPRLSSRLTGYNSSILSITKEDDFVFIKYSDYPMSASEIVPKEINHLIALKNKLTKANKNVTGDMEEYIIEKLRDSFKTTYNTYVEKHLVILYEIYNYGANNALEVNFKINDNSACPQFYVLTNKPKRIIIIFDEETHIEDTKEIEFSLTYTDICSLGNYNQKEKIKIYRKNLDFCVEQIGDINLCPPVEIKKQTKLNY